MTTRGQACFVHRPTHERVTLMREPANMRSIYVTLTREPASMRSIYTYAYLLSKSPGEPNLGFRVWGASCTTAHLENRI